MHNNERNINRLQRSCPGFSPEPHSICRGGPNPLTLKETLPRQCMRNENPAGGFALLARKKNSSAKGIGFVHHQQIIWDKGRTVLTSPEPIDLMRRPILNHLKRGETVYDPFLGSGTTLAAALPPGDRGHRSRKFEQAKPDLHGFVPRSDRLVRRATAAPGCPSSRGQHTPFIGNQHGGFARFGRETPCATRCDSGTSGDFRLCT